MESKKRFIFGKQKKMNSKTRNFCLELGARKLRIRLIAGQQFPLISGAQISAGSLHRYCWLSRETIVKKMDWVHPSLFECDR